MVGLCSDGARHESWSPRVAGTVAVTLVRPPLDVEATAAAGITATSRPSPGRLAASDVADASGVGVHGVHECKRPDDARDAA